MPLSVKYTPPRVNGIVAMAAAAEIASEIGGKLLLDASLPDCPTDTGEMKASGKVTRVGPAIVAVTFTREGADGYNVAARQHEDQSLGHPGGGTAKWLEKAQHSAGEAILHGMGEALGTGL